MKNDCRPPIIKIIVSFLLMICFSGYFTGTAQIHSVSTVNIPGLSLEIRPAHRWLPPFGLERVGNSTEALINIKSEIPYGTTVQLITFLNNKEVRRKNITVPDSVPFTERVIINENADLAMLYLDDGRTAPKEIGRQTVIQPAFEFDASAIPDSTINPVDLGTILVPADWLLLAHGQKIKLLIAGLSRLGNVNDASVITWYASSTGKKTRALLPLNHGSVSRKEIVLDKYTGKSEKDTLYVTVETKGGKELWSKMINVMATPSPKAAPSFGVIETKLRYDAGVLNIVNGKREHYDYYKAWKPELKDFVVYLPNGSRWVFWRGASYIPIWASRYNTGLSYEWAERISPNEGFKDCPEPLMDKELRYGTVKIIESTASRIHIRWDYQSCDFNYKVNGDFAHEDYYFYPDGSGTRALTLTSIPEAEYEVAEFILIASQATIPMQVLPTDPMKIISLKTNKASFISLPEKDKSWQDLQDPLIYRMRLHKNEPMSAFSFNPNLFKKPWAFKPFVDNGLVVTPAYWGGHWPLSQGFNTAYKIDESLWTAPSHNSLVTWGANKPKAIRSRQYQTKNALGKISMMREDTWTWLIGMTEASDEDLLKMARSYAQPPVLELEGAIEDEEFYSSERRAMCIIDEKPGIRIRIIPAEWCVNPVFEIKNASKNLKEVVLEGKKLGMEEYKWDGHTLWIKASFNEPKNLEVNFSE